MSAGRNPRLRRARRTILPCVLLAGLIALFPLSVVRAQSRRDPETAARGRLSIPTAPMSAPGFRQPDTPDPRIVEQVRVMSELYPMRPIVIPEVPYAGYYLRSQWMSEAEVLEELYRKYGSTGRWDDDALKILRLSSDDPAGDAPRPTVTEVRALAEKAVGAGCHDPLFLHAYGSLLMDAGDMRNGASIVGRALSAFPGTKYPKHAYWARPLVLFRAGSAPRAAERKRLRDRMAADALAATRNGVAELHHPRAFAASLLEVWSALPQADAEAIIDPVLESKDIDPWVRAVVRGEIHLDLGWQARGGGTINTVTGEGAREYISRIKKAKTEFLTAWHLHPDFPEGPTGMIAVAMESAVIGEPTRFWFDCAVRAQYDYAPAYESYRRSISPMWSGSQNAVIAFGLECLETGRFDTSVPDQLIPCLGFDPEIRYVPGYERWLRRLYEGKLAHAQATHRDDVVPPLQTRLAVIAHHSRRKADAKRLAEAAGDDLDLEYLARMNIAPQQLR